ncbi:hypothetical protein PMAC_002372 [Pneumocystis sp. 'macacae']|nr:hypothetical protein PMAC_002372 [Pneumocystis sp. 'macacae']
MYHSQQLPYGANTVYGYQGYQAYQQNLQASSGYVSGVAQAQPSGYGLHQNISKIDFNAPIIHFGTNVDQVKSQAAIITSAPVLVSKATVPRDPPNLLQPLTLEQQIRTLFIGAIPDYLDDFWIDKILKSVAKLKEWKRASNATGSLRNFGFAEYEDFEHVQRAIIVLEDLVVVDQKTRDYLDEWNEKRENKNPQRERSLIMQAKSNLIKVLEDFKDPNKRDSKKASLDDRSKEIQVFENKEGSKVFTVAVNADDELEDIPAEQREAVAREISSFRERSARREYEKLKREEEVERRKLEFERMAKLSVPIRPASQIKNPVNQKTKSENSLFFTDSVNDRRVGQIAKDYQKPVTFVLKEVNGYSRNNDDELDDTRSCEEIERERKNKKQKELEIAFHEREKRWLNREKSRTSALEREMNRDKEEAFREAKDREIMSRRLAEWDDDLEAERAMEEYYKDRSSWLRHRIVFRSREMEMDARDRALEERQDSEKSKVNTNANFFPKKHLIEHTLVESGINKDSGPIKLTFSSVKKQIDLPKRVVSEVEKLLEDDDDLYTRNKKPILLPLDYDDVETVEDNETRIKRIKDIVASVPSEKEGLWSWPIKWNLLTNSIIEDKIQPFIAKKIVEYVGVQEDELIKFILDHLQKRGSAEELAKELEMAMDEEAELFVNKIYRYVIVILETII